MAFTIDNGYQYVPALLSPQNDWLWLPQADGTLKLINKPFGVALETTGSGFLNRALSKTTTTTGSVRIADIYTLPAGALTGTRGLKITVTGKHIGSNTNATTTNVNFGGTGALDATVTGGVDLFTPVTNSTSGGAIFAQAIMYRTGASTQRSIGYSVTQASVLAALSPSLTATDTSAIQINLTLNQATANTDIVLDWTIELLF